MVLTMLNYDPYDRSTAEDPYPIYKRLRDEAPVYHSEERNFWALSRYDDVVAAHRDNTTFSSAGGVTIEGIDAGMPLLIVKDQPEHRWHKVLITKVFTVKRMMDLEPFTRNLVSRLLDELEDRTEFDFVQDFALQVPLQVISELIGIPPEYRLPIHEMTNKAIARDDGFSAETHEESAKRHMIYLNLVRERREHPRDDPITHLIQSEVLDDDGNMRQLDDNEMAIRFSEIASAGHETVAKAIPNGAVAFQLNPSQRQALIANAGLTESAAEEILRFDPPSQLQGRTTTRDVSLHGRTIPAGSKTMLITGAAMRDERHFERPDEFDIGRKPSGESIYFGLGIHRCLGIHLARIELRVVFEELFRRFPNFQVDPSRAVRPVLSNVRGLRSLPATLKG